jgi:3-oxoacyl-[acyl-carrier-protein] synthase-1
LGRGLTTAFREVVTALPEQTKIDHIICDMNGEPYRADEYGFTIVRTSQHFLDAGSFLSPADCWGDVGAASGPLFLALAVAANSKGYSPGPCVLLWASSEGGERSAVLVQLPKPKQVR